MRSRSRNFEIASEEAPRRKILVVEDDPGLNQAYRENLSDFFRVIAVRSGSGAVMIVKSMKDIDLVLLDYLLPDMSGIDVLREIKKVLPSLPVVLVTGHGSEDLAVRSFRSGAADYIKKPFRYRDLISRISSLVPCTSHQESRSTSECHEVIERDDQSPSTFSPCHHHAIEKVVRYIDENYMTEIALDQIAAIACMSPCHFSRLFKKVRGIGFKEHLHRKRIEKATELLHNPVLSVAEVAYTVGYGDLTHFERIFKKAANSTPSAYRNLLPKSSPSWTKQYPSTSKNTQ